MRQQSVIKLVEDESPDDEGEQEALADENRRSMVSLRNRLDDLASLYTAYKRLQPLKQSLQLWSALSDHDISKMVDQLPALEKRSQEFSEALHKTPTERSKELLAAHEETYKKIRAFRNTTLPTSTSTATSVSTSDASSTLPTLVHHPCPFLHSQETLWIGPPSLRNSHQPAFSLARCLQTLAKQQKSFNLKSWELSHRFSEASSILWSRFSWSFVRLKCKRLFMQSVNRYTSKVKEVPNAKELEPFLENCYRLTKPSATE